MTGKLGSPGVRLDSREGGVGRDHLWQIDYFIWQPRIECYLSPPPPPLSLLPLPSRLTLSKLRIYHKVSFKEVIIQ